MAFLAGTIIGGRAFHVVREEFPVLDPTHALDTAVPRNDGFIGSFKSFHIFDCLFRGFRCHRQSLICIFYQFALVHCIAAWNNNFSPTAITIESQFQLYIFIINIPHSPGNINWGRKS